MNAYMVMRICGGVICVWEIAKILLEYGTPHRQEKNQLGEEEYKATQEDILQRIREVISSRINNSYEYDFCTYLVGKYYFGRFTARQVQPEEWSISKTIAFLTHLWRNGILNRYSENGKLYYEFNLRRI